MIAAIMLAVLIVSPVTGAAGSDPCRAAIPAQVAAALRRAEPRYRLPLVSDSIPEDAVANRQQGGTGCLLVATGGFSGRGRKDYGLMLRETNGSSALLVVAYQDGKGWKIDTLSDWPADDSRAYVDVIDAGSYESISDIPAPGEQERPGHVRHVESSLPGVLAGTLEASGVAYFRVNGRWVHVWLSD